MDAALCKDIEDLERMSVPDLRGKYVEAFGEETRSFNKDFLRKRIAWRLQALAYGDISERARQRAAELANDADLRVRAPADPPRSLEAGIVRSMVTRRTVIRGHNLQHTTTRQTHKIGLGNIIGEYSLETKRVTIPTNERCRISSHNGDMFNRSNHRCAS